jgi:hypothetical protein
LTLVENTSPVGEVFVDKFDEDFWIIFDTLCLKNSPDTLEELCCDSRFVFGFNSELDHRASGVERFDDFVFVVAGKDKPAVAIKLLNRSP